MPITLIPVNENSPEWKTVKRNLGLILFYSAHNFDTKPKLTDPRKKTSIFVYNNKNEKFTAELNAFDLAGILLNFKQYERLAEYMESKEINDLILFGGIIGGHRLPIGKHKAPLSIEHNTYYYDSEFDENKFITALACHNINKGNVTKENKWLERIKGKENGNEYKCIDYFKRAALEKGNIEDAFKFSKMQINIIKEILDKNNIQDPALIKPESEQTSSKQFTQLIGQEPKNHSNCKNH